MNCPHCGNSKSNVQETRNDNGETFRRRKCAGCEQSFISCEYTQSDMKMPLGVVAKSLGRLNALKKAKRAANPKPAPHKPVVLDWVERRNA